MIRKIFNVIFGNHRNHHDPYDIFMIEMVALATTKVEEYPNALDRCKIILAQYMNDLANKNDPTALRVLNDVSRSMLMNADEFIAFGAPYRKFMATFTSMLKYDNGHGAMDWFECAYTSFLDDGRKS